MLASLSVNFSCFRLDMTFSFMLLKNKNICINSAGQKFNFGESFTQNVDISFDGIMVCVQTLAGNGVHGGW